MRRPNLVAAGLDLAFLALAGALGVVAAPILALAAAIAGHVAWWAWSRRRSLATLGREKRLAPIVVGVLCVLTVAQAGAYGLGLLSRGMT